MRPESDWSPGVCSSATEPRMTPPGILSSLVDCACNNALWRPSGCDDRKKSRTLSAGDGFEGLFIRVRASVSRGSETHGRVVPGMRSTDRWSRPSNLRTTVDATARRAASHLPSPRLRPPARRTGSGSRWGRRQSTDFSSACQEAGVIVGNTAKTACGSPSPRPRPTTASSKVAHNCKPS